jgi:hypothetical protein
LCRQAYDKINGRIK